LGYKRPGYQLMSNVSDVTGLLVAWGKGEEEARGVLMEAVYSELRRLARAYLRRERADHTLAPTALVHEAYLKLVDQKRVRWRNRAHFFAIAGHQMRRILVDHARAHRAAKRGGGAAIPLTGVEIAGEQPKIVDVLELETALDKLACLDPRQSRLVELRFFGGLSVEETATVLGVAPITVKRDWQLARTWLYRELRGSR
jgi:RNA polymerase sigma factor (TIGR02999 family)